MLFQCLYPPVFCVLLISHIHYALQINLMGQLHLLSSTVTTLAVPSPSLLATVARMSSVAIAAFLFCSEVISNHFISHFHNIKQLFLPKVVETILLQQCHLLLWGLRMELLKL